MRTSFTSLLGIQVPIMQAPIAGAAGVELVAAVSNAGALGSLPIWTFAPKRIPSLIASVMSLSSQPFSVNVRADLAQTEHVGAALDAGCKIIHLFWGDPTPYSAAVRAGGAKLLVTVADADEAKQALDAGADVLIAQGWEAGGHVRGMIATMPLVPTIVDLAGVVPVLASGGITDGRGLAAALMLGASGVAMGTRFAASEESAAHEQYKQALVAARQVDALLVRDLFGVGWENAPHRVLRNSTVRGWQAAGCPQQGRRPGESDVVGRYPNGAPILRYGASTPTTAFSGDIEAMALYAGQGVETIREIASAANIVKQTMAEAERCIEERR